jgi:hypothetical protein
MYGLTEHETIQEYKDDRIYPTYPGMRS